MYFEVLAALMLLQASGQVQYPTLIEAITGMAAIGATFLNLRLAANQSRADLKAKEDAEKLRQELVSRMEQVNHTFSEKLDKMAERFVPGSLDIERRSILNTKVEELKAEVIKARDRTHEQANKVQELLLGPIENIHSSLRDKGNRLASIEERSRTIDERFREIEDRVTEIERRK